MTSKCSPGTKSRVTRWPAPMTQAGPPNDDTTPVHSRPTQLFVKVGKAAIKVPRVWAMATHGGTPFTHISMAPAHLAEQIAEAPGRLWAAKSPTRDMLSVRLRACPPHI